MFSRVSHRLFDLAIVIGLVSAVLTVGLTSVHAAPDYYLEAILDTPTCATGPITMTALETARINLPVGGVIIDTAVVNGKILFGPRTEVRKTAISGIFRFGPLQTNVAWPVTLTYTLDVFVNGLHLSHSVSTISCSAVGIPSVSNNFVDLSRTNSGANVHFFAPGDARVDPRPGDRLVIYCDQKDRVVVYGIDDTQTEDKQGFLLAVFNAGDVQAGGIDGLTENLGENGTLSISLNRGWYWVAWNGGKFGATGKDIWVKNFSENACS